MRAEVSGTRRRLTLRPDGGFLLEDWRDLGGRWIIANRGRYLADETLIRLEPEFLSLQRWEAGLVRAPLHRVKIGSEAALVPEARLSGLYALLDQQEEWRYLDAGWYVFRKQALPYLTLCRDRNVYGHALTPGKAYLVVEARPEHLRLVGDHGRLRWFPRACFWGA